MTRSPSPAVRRLVLAAAMALATLVASAWHPAPVDAAGNASLVVQAPKEAAREAADAASEAAREAGDAARDAAREAANAARDAARDAHDARKGKIVIGFDGDRQYDSFDQFLDKDPGLAAMVLGVVFIVFLTPILIIALIIWYKIRRARMQNEAMLRLAERGVVAPADAVQALATGRVDALAAPVSVADQASTLTRRAAWSDLRKGVLLAAVGFAFVFHSMVDEGSANWFGLVLLFVGVGYIVLWYFEDRQAAAFNAGRASVGPGTRSAGDSTT
ncbi:MAG: DUF6249 domain-containing protein [Burkholderiales bacterium]